MATKEGSFSVEDMKNVQINIGAVVKEAEEWDQEMGACPKPGVATLRSWDHILANRYKIMYAPADDTCTLCTYGPCDLTGNKRGACGIDQAGACGKIVLIACLMGYLCALRPRQASLSLVHGQIRRHEVRHGRRDSGRFSPVPDHHGHQAQELQGLQRRALLS